MEPKGIYRQETVDDVKIPGNADSGKGKTYAKHIIYNDGTEVWEYHRYSGQGTENDPLVSTETTVNEDQQKRWDSQVRQQTPSATSQATAGKQTQNREMSVNPATGKPAWKITNYDRTVEYDEANVPASAAKETAKGQKATLENGEMVTREIEPDGSQGRIVEQRPATKAEIENAKGTQPATGSKRTPVPKHPGIYEVTNAQKDGGNETSETHYEDEAGNRVPTPVDVKEPEKPTIREDPNNPGKWISIQNDPSQPGGVKITSVAGPQGERSQIPMAGDIQGELGELVPKAMKRRDELTAIYNAGGMDKATYEKQAAQIMADANSRQVELNNLLTQQNNIQTQQGNQRGQTINESATNTNFSSSALDRAMKHTLTPYGGGPGSGETSARALQSLLKMQSDYAWANGGLSQTTPVQPTAFQKHVLTIDPSGSIKIETGAGGGGVVPDVGAGTGLPGAGVGPNGESLTRPGFSEGMDLSSIGSMMSQGNPIPAGPDPTELMQDLQDDSDPDWMNAIAMNGAEAMGGVA